MKILAIDIETSPNLAHVWGLFNQNISLSQLRDVTEVLCFAAKWIGSGSDETEFYSQHHHDKHTMIGHAHRLLDEADVVMTWNGMSFDVPHLFREFLEQGLRPPAPFEQIDLCRVVKKRFRFASNKLQHVSTRLGLEGKVSHEGHALWVKCLAGDDAAWGRMRTYNVQDVVLLEDIYNLLRPWIPRHPNVGLAAGEGTTCSCGSTRLQRRGEARTKLGVYQRYQCQDCGRWMRAVRREQGATLAEVAA